MQRATEREDVGAVTPLTVMLGFDGVSGFSNRQATSALFMDEQNGFPAGTLSSFAIGNDGTVTGTFSNGLTRSLGQVVLATFSNPEGLVVQGNNEYLPGPNSGVARITTPLSQGAGGILSGSIELSNVDLSREFIGLITASTGFSAASRVITTSNELLNQLLALAR